MARQDLTAELYYSSSWHTVAAYTRDPALINRERPAGAEPCPSSVSLTLQGIYNPKDPLSALYGVAGQNTPIRVKLGTDVRFYGEVASWSPGRAIKGDTWTTITANGILRRLGQGADPLRSALTRAISLSATAPLAWWPLEDPERATVAASPLAGVQAMHPITEVRYTTSGGIPIAPGGAPNFAAAVGTPGTDKLVSLTNGGTLEGTIPQSSTSSEWSFEFVIRHDPQDQTTTFSKDIFMIIADGTYGAFSVNSFKSAPGFDSGVEIFHKVARDGSSSGSARAVYDPRDGAPHHIRYTVAQNGADYRARLYLDGNLADTADNFGSAMTGTVGQPRSIELNPQSATGIAMPAAIGQVVFWSSETVPVDTVTAAFGHLGEQAADRFERLCDEEGIPVTIEGTASQPMGPQPIEPLVAQFAEIEKTDDGVIFEPRDDYGLVYRTGRERRNRSVVLALDYGAHEVAPPLRPVLDDQATRNDVTVASRTGATVRAVRETGPLSVLAPPDGIGRYTTKVDVNPDSDDVLTDHASWWLHKFTVDGVLYERVTVYVDQLTAAQATAAAAVDYGDVITIDNPPLDESRIQVRLHVLGYSEGIESHRRTITYNCTRAAVYDTAKYGSDALGSRYGARTTVLAEDLTATETAADVTATGETWVTTASHPSRFPFDVTIGGLNYSCTAITGTTPNYTLTLARLGNDKTHSTGDAVTVTKTGRYGL